MDFTYQPVERYRAIMALLLAHLSTECPVSYCDHSPSVSVRHPSVCPSINFLVKTLASTNINQSAPNVVRVYMTMRPRMSLIMELIGSELSESKGVIVWEWVNSQ